VQLTELKAQIREEQAALDEMNAQIEINAGHIEDLTVVKHSIERDLEDIEQ
jgi:hypothetical protein